LFINSLCETLLRNFARLHRTRYRSTYLDTESTCRISNQAIRSIEARFAEPLRVNQLAAQAGLSAAYFNEVFKKATGLTPHQYLLRVRVERVSAALKENDTPLAEIAQNFGFSSQSHLNTAFRKITGVTPRQFRQHGRD
jgi:AraC family transcriptional regulator